MGRKMNDVLSKRILFGAAGVIFLILMLATIVPPYLAGLEHFKARVHGPLLVELVLRSQAKR
jgi:hypothetical protein